jgi:hypothetical protein
MNNKKLINLINFYGGNDEPVKYTSSLLNKYTNIRDKTIIKIDNLNTLLIEDNSESENDIFKIFEENNLKKKFNILNDLATEETKTFKGLIP